MADERDPRDNQESPGAGESVGGGQHDQQQHGQEGEQKFDQQGGQKFGQEGGQGVQRAPAAPATDEEEGEGNDTQREPNT